MELELKFEFELELKFESEFAFEFCMRIRIGLRGWKGMKKRNGQKNVTEKQKDGRAFHVPFPSSFFSVPLLKIAEK